MQKHSLTGMTEAWAGTLNTARPIESDWAFAGNDLASRNAKYLEGASLVNMVKEDLHAQRITVESCRDIIQYLGEHDPDTRRLLEGVLEAEGERTGESANRPKL